MKQAACKGGGVNAQYVMPTAAVQDNQLQLKPKKCSKGPTKGAHIIASHETTQTALPINVLACTCAAGLRPGGCGASQSLSMYKHKAVHTTHQYLQQQYTQGRPAATCRWPCAHAAQAIVSANLSVSRTHTTPPHGHASRAAHHQDNASIIMRYPRWLRAGGTASTT